MVLGLPVDRAAVGLSGTELDGSATLAQAEVKRGSVFPDLSEQAGWSIYLDDTTIVEEVSKAVAKSLKLRGRTLRNKPDWQQPTSGGESRSMRARA